MYEGLPLTAKIIQIILKNALFTKYLLQKTLLTFIGSNILDPAQH